MKRDSILRQIILPAVIVAAGFIIVAPLSGYITSARPPMPEGYEDRDLTFNGSRLKGFAFGMEGLMADWYYVRSLQYVGNKVMNSTSDFINIEDLSNLNPVLLYPLLTNATELDPHFVAAYSYGALVLPAIDREKAVEFATKGIENNPNEWRLYQYLGYIYWRLGQYDKASEIYETGSRIYGSAPFMKMMAASLKNEGGSRNTARAIFREMLENSDDEAVRLTATRRLQKFDMLDEMEAIDAALADFVNEHGRCPNNLTEIVDRLLKVKLPGDRDFSVDDAGRLVDPLGKPYLLERQNCKCEPQSESR